MIRSLNSGMSYDDINNEQMLRCFVNIGDEFCIAFCAWKDYIFMVQNGITLKTAKEMIENQYNRNHYNIIDVDPFVSVEVIEKAYWKQVLKKKSRHQWSYSRSPEKTLATDCYNRNNYWHSRDYHVDNGIPWNYLKVKVTDLKTNESSVCEARFERPKGDKAVLINDSTIETSSIFFGLKLADSVKIKNDHGTYYSDTAWKKVFDVLKYSKQIYPDVDSIWLAFLNYELENKTIPTKGIKALENKKDIKPVLEKLKQENNLLYKFYLWLHHDKVRDKVSNNQLLAAVLKKHGNNYDQLVAVLRGVLDKVPSSIDYISEITDYINPNNSVKNRQVCLLFEDAKEKVREKKAKDEWHLRNTISEQALGLGINSEDYPKLFTAVVNQKIPLSIFHKPGNKNDLINTEFVLWEQALSREGWEETIYNIAQDASRRTTYDKDVTPYLSFLFKIENYLHSITDVAWKAMPTFVESEWELEMDAPTEEGTVKKRSALTPVADNENCIVTIPYASLAITGRQTTYCYSQYYYVYEQYFIDPECDTPVVNTLERKLNGRDDYGLMYYTLTGTSRNRGYPTFLIIRELLENSIKQYRIHFHRVHPNRYKDGKATPAHRLIEECYRYMAGNVRAEEIHAQQGDLIFIRQDNAPKDTEEMKSVKEFESHQFVVPKEAEPVKLLPNQAKSIKNRLGHIYATTPFKVQHPEHMDLPENKMTPGWYEVRRCKSWEANPTAVWSFTID